MKKSVLTIIFAILLTFSLVSAIATLPYLFNYSFKNSNGIF